MIKKEKKNSLAGQIDKLRGPDFENPWCRVFGRNINAYCSFMILSLQWSWPKILLGV